MSDEEPKAEHILLARRAQALRIIESWESRIRILFQEYADTRPDATGDQEDQEGSSELVEDQLQDELETIRETLFERLKSVFSSLERDVPSKTYEQVVYALVSDRMRRYYGYYEAINRAAAEASALNNEVGAEVFRVDVPGVTKLLSSIDEVYFVKYLCMGLGLTPDLTDKIVNYTVDKEFKPRSK